MKKEKWTLKLILILLIININLIGKDVVVLNNEWENIKGKSILLSDIIKNDDKIYVIYFKATDCSSCIINAFNVLRGRFSKVIGIFGYIYDDELELYENLMKKSVILKDKRYKLFKQMKLKKIYPVLLIVNKNREIINTLGYFELIKYFE